ncbi:metallophosphoesterase family protein [Candidatus Woesebacteria bacterium]|nr:metallophosphoesterase family protein [Candidatus Woesebacteria bacterium]
MKILIFSDSHLTHKFDKELFDYISKLVKNVDQVIINGDFWDAYLTSYKKFTNSKWNELFPILKKKNTIYVFGNHDKKKFMNGKHDLFSIHQADDYEFKSGNRDFYITHGHLISPTYDNILFFRNPMFVRFLYRIFVFLTRKVKVFAKLFNPVEKKKNHKKLEILKEYSDKKKIGGQFFIFGHSHVPMLNISDNFISLGTMQGKMGGYCIIDDGKIDLFNE